MPTSYDVIVIGAGSMGMSAGYHLAKNKVKVLLIDKFDPPHAAGSHHGETRLIRHAYAGSSSYTAMAIRADRLWKELEEASGQRLLVRSGVLNMGAAKSLHMGSKLKSTAAFGLKVDQLNADEIRKRWPGVNPPDSYIGLYEHEAGFLYSEACVRAYRQQALAAGARLLVNTQVAGIKIGKSGVTVQTLDGAYHADQLILSAGAWFSKLNAIIHLPIRSVRKAVAWFNSDESLYDSARFPGFTLGAENGGFYGFPSIDGSGVKIGRHDAGQPWKPGQPFEPFGHYAEDEKDLRQALEAFLPQASGQVLRGAVCKYELTPDEHFIIDRHPEHAHVLLAGGFSGHGFKFASVVGEILSDLSREGTTEQEISSFALSRFSANADLAAHIN
ncbi:MULTISPECIES: N-methyl-L-tryptophan oxidase [unclassified Paenibacillus]|uniref:N-methyl-L-tryptophan oxidase n=1 Tax=unclassified Paenibacillus TaxID=185978 RepID=UPI00070FFA88|nr:MULTISPECIES: N-methyl-L-tryptophan oxidase [unclassified Paenibacillus]KQX48211.1 methyltryptophan oxidase [Paenibacillus sp. Root444D2]KRE52176.1 methyltryptophan oxidase [Paenibacillus sp. Soil724D2]